MATTSWPTFRAAELLGRRWGDSASMRMTGQIGVGIFANKLGTEAAAVGYRLSMLWAPWTTWLLVKMNPSG